MVDYDDLVLLVLVGVELRDELVGFDACPWEVQRLADVVLLVLLRLAKVYQKEIRLNAHRELLGADGD